jgi:hypothetical protein
MAEYWRNAGIGSTYREGNKQSLPVLMGDNCEVYRRQIK